MGLLENAEKNLTREICEVLNVDRASIWLHGIDRDSIVLQELYIKNTDSYTQGTTLYKKDFEAYFSALEDDPILIATDAVNHKATSCFAETYLCPLGIVSMLDIPIWFSGSLIGVICIENLSKRDWLSEEISYTHIMSSLYSFAKSVHKGNELYQAVQKKDAELRNRMDAINNSNAVIEFDTNHKIIYANKHFLDAMGYEHNDIVGADHSIFVEEAYGNSEEYQNFWQTLISGIYYSDIVTRVRKDGELVYLQATYNPIFNSNGEVYRVMKIAVNVTENYNQRKEIEKKNTYLEHAAKILRHDMHSGINTYIPRGISSLERRLSEEQQKELKIDGPIKMIKEGLRHTQKVYKGVYEFTNLVKKNVVLNRSECDLKAILKDYLSATAYSPQVLIEELGMSNVNEPLFCTAIDNLIRNGLKYNDSDNKIIKIYRKDDLIFIEDNGRGMSAEEFKLLSQPYTRKEDQKESGTGLGLNICIAILEEHRFAVTCNKLSQGGTQITIKIT